MVTSGEVGNGGGSGGKEIILSQKGKRVEGICFHQEKRRKEKVRP